MASISAKRVSLRGQFFRVATISLLLGAALPAWGAIGDTREELAKHYGAGKAVGGQMLYKVDSYSVSIYFSNDKSSMEVYARLPLVDGTHEELTLADVDKLLRLQGGDGKWNVVITKKGDKTWSRPDGKVIARFKPEDKAFVVVDASLK